MDDKDQSRASQVGLFCFYCNYYMYTLYFIRLLIRQQSLIYHFYFAILFYSQQSRACRCRLKYSSMSIELFHRLENLLLVHDSTGAVYIGRSMFYWSVYLLVATSKYLIAQIFYHYHYDRLTVSSLEYSTSNFIE